ncbi:hypothetical protein [Lacticaseibacillus absianus]|uniref:hypothetical protein n=1 Tax=Lacticaseibacillus absianus TaxID=2729623 RepID=UPI0015C911C0|nr:hypothetical protein [Lacticaseibacillus absianus]
MTHKTYITKAEDFYRSVSAPDADPKPLAEWAETANPTHFAIVTASGAVVGEALYRGRRDRRVAYVDKATAKKYGVIHEVLDMAMGDISKVIGEPVVAAKASLFNAARSAGLLDAYLDKFELTRYKLEKATGINASTWQNVNEKPLSQWKVGQVQTLADTVGKSTRVVMSELEKMEDEK